MSEELRYDYTLDPDEDNNTAASIYRFCRSGGVRVLDLGAGPGVVAAALAGDGHDVVAVDLDEEALTAARERGVQRTIVGDLSGTQWLADIGQERFDTVILADVLEHLVDPGALLEVVLARLLDEDGQLVVSVPNVGHEAVIAGLAQGQFRYTETGLLDSTHLRFFTHDSLHRLLERHGFVVRRLERTLRTLEQTEQFRYLRDASPDMRSLLRDHGLDSRTYQFVVVARPSNHASELAALRDQFAEEQDRHVRELEQLRTAEHDNLVDRLDREQTANAEAARRHDETLARQRLQLEQLRDQRLEDATSLEDQRAELNEARRRAEESEAAVVRQTDEFERVSTDLERVSAELEMQRGAMQQLEASLAARDRELRDLRRQYQEQYDARQRYRRNLHEVEDRLDEVYDSTSFQLGWRMLAPVRLVRGRTGPPFRRPRTTEALDDTDEGGAGGAEQVEAAPDRLELARTPSSRRAVYDAEVARESFSSGTVGVVMLCSTTDLDAGRGDVYTACGLGIELQAHGFEVVYRPFDRWDDLPNGTSIVVSLLAEPTMVLDPTTVPAGVHRIAWVRNNTERWVRDGALGLYDLVLCSGPLTAEKIAEHYAGPIEVLRIGVDPELFEAPPGEVTRSGVIATVNQWGGVRRTYAMLAEDRPDVPLGIYGVQRELDHRLRPYQHGPVSYFEVPSLYQQVAVVLDDQQGVNAPFGNVNSRVYESLASGALPISGAPLGLADVGLEDLPVWRDSVELRTEVERWAADHEGRSALVSRLRGVVLRDHTYAVRAERFAELVDGLVPRREPVLGFTPDYRVTNPFQDLLYSAADGITALPFAGPRAFLQATGLRDRPRVFHQHWVSTIMGPAGHDRREARRRKDEFLSGLDDLRSEGVTIVWTVHNVLHHETKHPELEVELRRGIADRADIVHLLSPETIGAAAEAGYELPMDKLFVGQHPSYLGVYPSAISREAARRELDLPDDAFVYLALGQIRPYKGMERLLASFRAHAERHDDARLVVAGLPGKFEGVRELVDEIRSTPATVLHDRHVEDHELQVFLKAANVVVLPHRRVLNSGLAWLAFSFARPVIAPRTGALAGLVTDELGVHFPPDAESLAQALDEARKLGARHGRAAFELAQENEPAIVSRAFLDEVSRVAEVQAPHLR